VISRKTVAARDEVPHGARFPEGSDVAVFREQKVSDDIPEFVRQPLTHGHLEPAFRGSRDVVRQSAPGQGAQQGLGLGAPQQPPLGEGPRELREGHVEQRRPGLEGVGHRAR